MAMGSLPAGSQAPAQAPARDPPATEAPADYADYVTEMRFVYFSKP